jgi:hypothetical protein
MQTDQSDSVPSALHVLTCIPQLPQPRDCGVQHWPQLHWPLHVRVPPPSQVISEPGAHAP